MLWNITGRSPAQKPMDGKIPVTINSEKIAIFKQQPKTLVTNNGHTSELESLQIEDKLPLSPKKNLVDDHQKVQISEQDPQSGKEGQVRKSSEKESLSIRNQCYQISPLSETEGLRLLQHLKAQDYPSKSWKELVLENVGYIVLLGPYTTKQQTMSKLKQLKIKKIDAFMINRGKWNRAISLGIYSNKENALSHQKMVVKQLPGDNVRIQQRVNEKTVVFVQMKVPDPDLTLKSVLFLDIFAQKQLNFKKISKKSCKEIEF